MKFTIAAVAAVAAVAEAQNSSMSLCDKYTTALLKNNTGSNQLTLLTYLVNTVVAGNFTKPNLPDVTFPTNYTVPGILATFKGSDGKNQSLLPYFDGGLASSNRGGSSGVAVNFLDGGAGAPLVANPPMPAWSNATSSNQYFLLTHLYQFFGAALGCSQQGFPSYMGEASQYSVHKYMALDHDQVTYFIEQVGLAALSFGVSYSDATAVGTLLTNLFNYRCTPKATVIPSAGPVYQSICITEDCPTPANNSDCSAYPAVMEPGVANASLAMGLGNSSSTATSTAANGGSMTGSATMTMTGSATMSASSGAVTTGAAVKNAVGGLAAGGLAMAAFLL